MVATEGSLELLQQRVQDAKASVDLLQILGTQIKDEPTNWSKIKEILDTSQHKVQYGIGISSLIARIASWA